jgi:PAS domain S-box-containing protein
LREADRPARFGPRSPAEFTAMPFGTAVVSEQQSARGPGGVIVGRGREPGRGRVSVVYDALVARVRRIANSQSPALSDQRLASIITRYVNQGAQMQSGYTADELLEMTALELLATERTEVELRALVRPLASGHQDVVTITNQLVRKDGRAIEVEAVLQRAPGPDQTLYLASYQLAPRPVNTTGNVLRMSMRSRARLQ